MRTGMWIAGAALVASLGLNAYLLRDAREAQARRAKASAAREHPPESAPAAGDEACRAELERCRDTGWKLLAKAVAAQGPKADGAAAPASAPVVDGERATPARQRQALCDIANDHLRAHWDQQKELITRGVAADLADPTKRAEQARTTAARMASTLGLTPAQADGLSAEYDRIHASHTAPLVAALGRTPPDYAAALDTLKGLYADEDAMLGRLRGEGAVERWRAQEIQGRTAVLAITATFAGDPWDDTILW